MLDRSRRLVSAEDFRQVFRRGRKVSTPGGIVVVLARQAGSGARFGFVVSRAVGSAVKRNLVKRRLREAAKWVTTQGTVNCDVVVRANPDAVNLTVDQWRQHLTRAVRSEVQG